MSSEVFNDAGAMVQLALAPCQCVDDQRVLIGHNQAAEVTVVGEHCNAEPSGGADIGDKRRSEGSEPASRVRITWRRLGVKGQAHSQQGTVV
jgi:hypothetical protein